MTKPATIELPLTFKLPSGAAVGCTDLLCGANPNDIWMTPDHTAKDIVNHFKPTGRLLDPCKGDGAFVRAMPGCAWCEVREGRNFYDWHEPVDWIISNPPYSIYDDFMAHAMRLAPDIVWLIPLSKAFHSWPRMKALRDWGGMKEIRVYGRGSMIGYDMNFTCGAIHFRKDWRGDTAWSFAA